MNEEELSLIANEKDFMNRNSCLDHRTCIFPIFNGRVSEADDGCKFTQNLYLGTGFLIRRFDRTFFVTASHVVDPRHLDDEEDGAFIFYFARPGLSGKNQYCGIPSSKFSHHLTADIAYVEISDEIHKQIGGEYLPIAKERLSLGQSFFSIGYPFTAKDSPTSISLEQFVFRGHIASRYDKRHASKLRVEKPAEWNYVLNIDAVQGLSGAPILSDDNDDRIFEVVGLVYGSQETTMYGETHRFGVGTELSEISAIGDTW